MVVKVGSLEEGKETEAKRRELKRQLLAKSSELQWCTCLRRSRTRRDGRR